jgi:hypothetical protein
MLLKWDSNILFTLTWQTNLLNTSNKILKNYHNPSTSVNPKNLVLELFG